MYELPFDSRGISIHPPLVGWDGFHRTASIFQKHFNPPTPCGVGLMLKSGQRKWKTFQSTHPLWGGTPTEYEMVKMRVISIHPPLVGWDSVTEVCSSMIAYFNPPTPCGVGHLFFALLWKTTYFNPPTPCGVGLFLLFFLLLNSKFQSTHPLWGGTILSISKITTKLISIHPPLVGWDLQFADFCRSKHISIHPPLVGWDSKRIQIQNLYLMRYDKL